MDREIINSDQINNALHEVKGALMRRLSEKGFGAFASTHEMLGVVVEEYYEFVESIKENDNLHIRHELNDLAVACIFSIACMNKIN